ncbi:MAG TPA: hypothetical protein VK875_03645 [Euzebyales bacterium]|nr:hypothetical protein [Euzebyales bacterium]
MAGKLTKLASGVFMTHYMRSKIDTGLLADLTARAGAGAAVVAAVREANTARQAAELWAEHEVTAAPDLLCAAVAVNLVRFTDGAVRGDAVMVDFAGRRVLGASRGWWGPRA